jgi:hypothetical protein
MHQAHARGKSSEATFSGSRQKGNARMATLLFQNPVSQLPGVIAWVAVKAGGKEPVLGRWHQRISLGHDPWKLIKFWWGIANIYVAIYPDMWFKPVGSNLMQAQLVKVGFTHRIVMAQLGGSIMT